jgi:hypothetical protein
MKCLVLVHLIEKLDMVRAEQSNPPRNISDAAKKGRLRSIEKFLDLHQRTCPTCRRKQTGAGFISQGESARFS